jgi:hypothetical protein
VRFRTGVQTTKLWCFQEYIWQFEFICTSYTCIELDWHLAVKKFRIWDLDVTVMRFWLPTCEAVAFAMWNELRKYMWWNSVILFLKPLPANDWMMLGWRLQKLLHLGSKEEGDTARNTTQLKKLQWWYKTQTWRNRSIFRNFIPYKIFLH